MRKAGRKRARKATALLSRNQISTGPRSGLKPQVLSQNRNPGDLAHARIKAEVPTGDNEIGGRSAEGSVISAHAKNQISDLRRTKSFG
jgi:hypothetical protein